MSTFHLLSWISCLATGGLIIFIYLSRPSIAVKPSFIAILFLFLHNQIGSAVLAPWIEDFLSEPWVYFIIAHLFPPVALLVSQFFFRDRAKRVHDQLLNTDLSSVGSSRLGVVILGGIIAAIMFWYFQHKSLSETGLYAILMLDPRSADLARESSMTLLGNRALAYAFLGMASTVAPVLCILLGFRLRSSIWPFRPFQALVTFLFIVLILVCVSIYGARGESVIVLLGVIYALLVSSRSRHKLRHLVICVFLVLLIPSVLTALREGKVLGLDSFLASLVNVFDRAFGRSVIPGVWHADYVERFGLFGLSGINNLASFLGLERVNVYNVVGVYYTGGAYTTITANTTFVITYFACFGVAAFFLCLFLLLILDWYLLIYDSLHGPYQIACVAACQIAVSRLASTSFTTIFLTCGLMTIPILCLILSYLHSGWWHRRIRNPVRVALPRPTAR